ncbi:hypothetical protein V1477_020882 [Vespula maculifrons]|uniref:Uncharacterized protein n=1 Tax=Vespula maculifrons TaxID=7453 RepID=A0ABD2AP26_VESMC
MRKDFVNVSDKKIRNRNLLVQKRNVNRNPSGALKKLNSDCVENLRVDYNLVRKDTNDTASSLVEQSMNVESALKSVKTLQSTQSVQTKSVIESSTSIKSVTTSSSRSHRSLEYEESVEYTDE